MNVLFMSKNLSVTLPATMCGSHVWQSTHAYVANQVSLFAGGHFKRGPTGKLTAVTVTCTLFHPTCRLLIQK